MTTIACDGKSIAADGFITGNGTIHDTECIKVFILSGKKHPHWLAGFCGSAYYHHDALAFLNGDKHELDLKDEDAFEAILLDPLTGQCWTMDGTGRFMPQVTPAASGSGHQFALAAMALGKTAKQAVEVAAQLDIYTGGTIREVRVTKKGDSGTTAKTKKH